jgi:hypothetical protein
VLASTFVGDDQADRDAVAQPEDRVLAELRQLREQVQDLSRQLAGLPPSAEASSVPASSAPEEPPGPPPS